VAKNAHLVAYEADVKAALVRIKEFDDQNPSDEILNDATKEKLAQILA
jgi:hypothetical protein